MVVRVRAAKLSRKHAYFCKIFIASDTFGAEQSIEHFFVGADLTTCVSELASLSGINFLIHQTTPVLCIVG